ncbi:MFS transporter [Dactylosporangium sp. NPDC050588]|uniref:MFS transporter n=1 Tax=Dactylosporangium sp. NPDC050588 TaxID=3157211 RepID=UPI0033C29223
MRSERTSSMRSAALGTALVFTASGTLLGTWVSRIPAVVAKLDVTAGELGRALLALGIGSLLSMPLTGHVCRRLGSRTWVACMSVAAAVVLSCTGLAPDLVWLSVALFALGMVYGSWDVAMNVQGSAVDQLAGREWMPRYHACWSLGSILGAAAGSLAARGGTGIALHFAVAACCATAVTFAGLLRYVDERVSPAPSSEESVARPAGPPVRNRALLLIGALTLCATVIEGAAGDWLALYLHTGRGLSEASAALGYSVFATAMTVVRFAGTPAAARLGRAGAVRAGGLLGIAGVLITVLSPWVPLTYAGALLWGAGVCLVFPAAVSAAGETDRPAESIALVTTIGYGSILIGPPLIGALADVVGMGRALLTLAVLAAGVAALAPAVRPSPDRTPVTR